MDAISELIEIKMKLEIELRNLEDRSVELKKKIQQISDEKLSLRKLKTGELIMMEKLKLERVDEQKQTELDDEYLTNFLDNFSKFQVELGNEVKILDYEREIMDLNGSIESAINFYGDDNLQMELMKRANLVREHRVEYTRLESEIQDKIRLIESRNAEKERAKLRPFLEKSQSRSDSPIPAPRPPAPDPIVHPTKEPSFSQFFKW